VPQADPAVDPSSLDVGELVQQVRPGRQGQQDDRHQRQHREAVEEEGPPQVAKVRPPPSAVGAGADQAPQDQQRHDQRRHPRGLGQQADHIGPLVGIPRRAAVDGGGEVLEQVQHGQQDGRPTPAGAPPDEPAQDARGTQDDDGVEGQVGEEPHTDVALVVGEARDGPARDVEQSPRTQQGREGPGPAPVVEHLAGQPVQLGHGHVCGQEQPDRRRPPPVQTGGGDGAG